MQTLTNMQDSKDAPYGQSPWRDSGFRRVWLKHNLKFKGMNYQVHREFPGKFKSANLSRDNLSRDYLSREIGCKPLSSFLQQAAPCPIGPEGAGRLRPPFERPARKKAPGLASGAGRCGSLSKWGRREATITLLKFVVISQGFERARTRGGRRTLWLGQGQTHHKQTFEEQGI